MRLNDGHDPFVISTDRIAPAVRLCSYSSSNSSLPIGDYVSVYAQILEKVRQPDGTFELVTSALPA